MKDELLNKRLKLEEEYHDLLDRDHNRFSVADLQDFMEYLDSRERIEDVNNLFKDTTASLEFSFYDLMNWLERRRNGN